MDIVLRPVNDTFLTEIAFPSFELGMTNAGAALEQLHQSIADARAQTLIEVLLSRGVDGAFWSLDEGMWIEVMYRLLFWDWRRTPEGWTVEHEHAGYAAERDRALHVALMLESPGYPYWDETAARLARDTALSELTRDLGLASLLGGVWRPVPRFAPHEVISMRPHGSFKPGEHALADWSFRDAATVSLWNQQLRGKLSRLLKREETRLKPVELPDADTILGYWLGRLRDPPAMTVAFSGLGRDSGDWVRELGALLSELRHAAARGQGLTSIATMPPSTLADFAL